jgi:hypothetical protein
LATKEAIVENLPSSRAAIAGEFKNSNASPSGKVTFIPDFGFFLHSGIIPACRSATARGASWRTQTVRRLRQSQTCKSNHFSVQ